MAVTEALDVLTKRPIGMTDEVVMPGRDAGTSPAARKARTP